MILSSNSYSNANRFKIFIVLKKNVFSIILVLFTVFLIVFSNQNLLAAKSGLILWANGIVPSLFPFFIATELLNYTNIIYILEKILTPITKPLFNVSGAGTYAFIMGTISGYPIGAKIVAHFRKNNICSKEECERLLAFTNNSGPLFIIGTVGISMFYNSTIGFLLFITHLLACLSVGIIFRFWKYNKTYKNELVFKRNKSNDNNVNRNNSYVSITNKEIYFSNLGEILTKSIVSAVNSVLIIGGFVVLFSIIISILKNTHLNSFFSFIIQPIFNIFEVSNKDFSYGFITGIIELTNGITYISNINCKLLSINIIITSILLGFSGISIFLQIYSIISNTDISIKPYIIGKILQGIFAGIYTYIFIRCFPIFNFNL